MKALTLTQPWASLVALREKEWETRSWPLPKNGLTCEVAIHAAKNYRKREFASITAEMPFYAALRPDGNYCYPELLCGKVLCIVRIVACERAEDVRGKLSWKELQFGDYSYGRFAFRLQFVRAIQPVDAVGHLGIWDWKAGIAEEHRSQAHPKFGIPLGIE